MCSDIRQGTFAYFGYASFIHISIQEFILLSDVLGVSTLVDNLNNAKPPGATEATVLGPFFTEDRQESGYLLIFIPQ